jgi:hypothetical protein
MVERIIMSVFSLKLIATITMLLDHIGFVYNINYFRVAGRVAFPIYAFLIASGCHHTKNLKKYILRLFMFAIISEIPYNMLFNVGMGKEQLVFFDNTSQNVFFTLFLGAFLIYAYSNLLEIHKNINIKKGLLFILIFGITLYVAYKFRVDYSMLGVSLIFFIYVLNNKYIPILLFALINYYPFGMVSIYNLKFFISALIPIVLIAFYNGKKGYDIKWLFYVFYPLHMIILAISVFI